VFSVPTKEAAETLIMLVGSLQYEEHPLLPGRPWKKINIGFKRYLELGDLPEVTAKLQAAWVSIEQRKKE
jgi:hypothetical protein